MTSPWAILPLVSVLSSAHPAPEFHTFHAVQFSFKSQRLVEVLANFSRITEKPVLVDPSAQPLLNCVRLSIATTELSTLEEARTQLQELLLDMGVTLTDAPAHWTVTRKKGAEIPWGCKAPLAKPFTRKPTALDEIVAKNRATFRKDATQSRTYDPGLGGRVVPVYVKGKLLGLKVFSVRKNSPLWESGIQNGDVIVSIQGVKMDGSRKGLLYRALTVRQGNVSVLRRGTPVNVDLSKGTPFKVKPAVPSTKTPAK